MAMAYFQDQSRYVAKSIFPICPVRLSSANYYVFDKASLLRDNVSLKPQFGVVAPAQIGQYDQSYRCKVHQTRYGIDLISTQDLVRTNAPGVSDPRQAKVRIISQQMNIHLDIDFAKSYFRSGVWQNEWTGGAAYDEANRTFIKFSDDNCDPIELFDNLCTEIEQSTGRRPNRLGLGKDAYIALKNNPIVQERVKYGGSTANHARVNERVLAELFGVERVGVLSSIYNKAAFGAEPEMEFICDPKAALLAYATNAPAIDEPSAGYIFTWDMLGDGQYMPIHQYEGENGTYSEFIEGLLGYDMKKTADDLAIFLKDCV